MDRTIVNDIANSVVKFKLYPYFNACNYILMSMAVREDAPQSGSSSFSRRHPYACWFATMLMCFASDILAAFLTGESVLTILENTDELILATICWYAVNYSPFDIIYKLNRFPPIRFILCILKEIQRTKKIYKGVKLATKKYPRNIIMWFVVGVIKGAAYSYMKMFERLVRGVWLPASNEMLKPSFTTKASLAVSVLFAMIHLGKLSLDVNVAFLVAMTFLMYFRVLILTLGVSDPFSPLENIFCGVFFGGVIDALRNAWRRKSSGQDPTKSLSASGTAKSGSGSAGINMSGSGVHPTENGVMMGSADGGIAHKEEAKKNV